MASPPGSPVIPEAVQRLYEEHYITNPLFSALVDLQKQQKATGHEQYGLHNKNNPLNPSWGRQSPQLTPTPSPSPSPSYSCDTIKTSHLQLLGLPGANSRLHAPRTLPTPPILTPPNPLPQSATQSSMSLSKPSVARRPRPQRRLRTPVQSSHPMLIRSRARAYQASRRQFWELDASGRKARKIDDR
ncbi:hypothetical protein GQ44DRAFT_725238 [Phaeosphaeriaceae sp. PMI808]|nr:hypothetical protein GQ44DRAFT_725238 [Phaeosphaeriaceae sp. PMI808]